MLLGHHDFQQHRQSYLDDNLFAMVPRPGIQFFPNSHLYEDETHDEAAQWAVPPVSLLAD